MDGELQARQALQGLKKAREQAQGVARQAALMKALAKNIDGAELQRCANDLMKQMIVLRDGVQKLDPSLKSLSRMLSSKPPKDGGMSPAAKWGPELRAGSKQFFAALDDAEKKLAVLYKEAGSKLNDPTRHSGDPSNAFEAVLTIVDLFFKFVEYLKQKNKK